MQKEERRGQSHHLGACTLVFLGWGERNGPAERWIRIKQWGWRRPLDLAWWRQVGKPHGARGRSLAPTQHVSMTIQAWPVPGGLPREAALPQLTWAGPRHHSVSGEGFGFLWARPAQRHAQIVLTAPWELASGLIEVSSEKLPGIQKGCHAWRIPCR